MLLSSARVRGHCNVRSTIVLAIAFLLFAPTGVIAADTTELQLPPISPEPKISGLDLETPGPSLPDTDFPEEEPELHVANPFRACTMSDAELQEVKVRALEFLFEQHPELNRDCERLANEIAYAMDEKVCVLRSGLIRDEACREQAQASYLILLSFEFLEPQEVLWQSEPRFVPRNEGD